jgi:hypothetical protein
LTKDSTPYDEVLSGPLIELGHKCFENKDASEDGAENAGEEENNGYTREDTKFASPPRQTLFVLNPSLFNFERTTCAET